MNNKTYRVKLNVQYTVSIPVTALDSNGAIDEIDRILSKCDDYELVNRSTHRAIDIEDINEEYNNPPALKKKRKK